MEPENPIPTASTTPEPMIVLTPSRGLRPPLRPPNYLIPLLHRRMSSAFTDASGKLESTARTVAVQCPHCVADGKEEWQTWIEVDRSELNCRIFRHGCMRQPYEQRGLIVPIPPHAPKTVCEQLAATGTIIGCSKPYQIVDCEGGELKAVVCEYI